MCGEHSQSGWRWGPSWGSSPRVRGTPRNISATMCMAGIIPACAGNTSNSLSPISMSRDHPRVCGEHSGIGTANVTAKGSSPRVRGTHGNRGWSSGDDGIIPACAGNTRAGLSLWRYPRDHPRVCGEHHCKHTRCATPMGSSPRVRGTPIGTCPNCPRRGIIPACAGNTRCDT